MSKNFVSTVRNLECLSDYSLLVKNNQVAGDVLVAIKELSRFGTLESSLVSSFVKQIKAHNLRPILVWDVLQTEDQFTSHKKIFESLPIHEFSRIRVQDPGVFEFIKTHYSWLEIELILETGNHNTAGLLKWMEYGGVELKKMILSLEIPKEKLKEIIGELKQRNPKMEFELLIFGPILLFYTPRNLLSALEGKDHTSSNRIDGDGFIRASGTSEESPHSGFPLIENQHGTFMFNTKDHSLISEIPELEIMGVTHFRFDLEILNPTENLKPYSTFFHDVDLFKLSEEMIQKLKDRSVRPLIKGFFQTNKSDVLFTKLKNRKIERKDDSYVGEIIDVERDEKLCLWVKSLSEKTLNKTFKIITPEGKEKTLTLNSDNTKRISGIEAFSLLPGEYYLIPYHSGITVKSKVYEITNTTV